MRVGAGCRRGVYGFAGDGVFLGAGLRPFLSVSNEKIGDWCNNKL